MRFILYFDRGFGIPVEYPFSLDNLQEELSTGKFMKFKSEMCKSPFLVNAAMVRYVTIAEKEG